VNAPVSQINITPTVLAAAGLVIGDSGFGSVGEYESPDLFSGKVANVRIKGVALK
jgi:hypothetical protein